MSDQIQSCLRDRRRAGLSLIEMVTVISLTGVLSVGLAGLLQHPMNGYVAVSRRAELVDLGHLAIGRITRDLRQALPNSVRVAGGGRVLELMHTPSGARYREEPGINDPGGPDQEDHQDPTDWISFGGDDAFNILGRFQGFPFSYGSALPSGTRIAIYPTGPGIWAEAAAGANPSVITPQTSTIRITNDVDEDQLRIAPAHRFTLASPGRRLYLVDTPVTYLCNPADTSLWRVDGYTMTATQPSQLASAPLVSGRGQRAASRVESCAFEYNPGSSMRGGLVTLEIVLAHADERVRLLQQVHIDNAP